MKAPTFLVSLYEISDMIKEVDDSKYKRIEEIKNKLEKKFGKGTLMGANDKVQEHGVISTGSVGLDKALGIKGLPKGKIIEIYGPESSGKTTLVLESMAQAHKDPNAYCAFIDAEHALDRGYAKALGVDLDRLEICQPTSGENALEVAEALIGSGEFAIVAIDSVAALTPQSEIDGDMGDSNMGKHARLMSQAMRKLTGITSKTDTILIFINQLRDKIGVMFGSPETTTGGNALKFYASIRMDIRRSVTKENSVMSGTDKIGNSTTVKVVKNKCAPPFRQCTFNILYGEGIDTFGEVIDAAIESDIIKKSGSWFSYEGNKIGQGKESVKELLKKDNELYNEIKDKVFDTTVEVFTPTEEEAALHDS